MFEQISQLAEQTATRASRRQFLGRVGRGAMAAAMAMGGLLAAGADAHAKRRPSPICVGNSEAQCLGKAEGTPCALFRRFGTCKGVLPGEGGVVCICWD